MSFAIDPLSNADDDNTELLGIVDENSEDAMLHNNESMEYTIKGEDGVVEYRVVQFTDPKTITVPTTAVASTLTTSLPQQFYVISDLNVGNVYTNNAQPIAPKTSTTPQNKPVPNVVKKRDDRRRATHNEVERRRRDKINHWIMKLGSMIPADGLPDSINERPNVIEGQSKGGILSKACEYITTLHNKVDSQTECLKDKEKTHLENKKLRETNKRLQMQNEILRNALKKNGISFDKDTDPIVMS